MDKRINELRERLWKKKSEARQKENIPVWLSFLFYLFDILNNAVFSLFEIKQNVQCNDESTPVLKCSVICHQNPFLAIFLLTFFRIIIFNGDCLTNFTPLPRK